ncbi:hypothetical protein U3516DRAFT_780380 [Neocallimastix sp. 'constans']
MMEILVLMTEKRGNWKTFLKELIYCYTYAPPNVNIYNNDGETPLNLLCYAIPLTITKKMLQLILETPIDINKANNEEDTGLMVTSDVNIENNNKSGYHKVVKSLIRKGTDVNIADNSNFYVMAYYIEITDLLVKRNPDMMLFNEHKAKLDTYYFNNKEAVNYLIHLGAED